MTGRTHQLRVHWRSQDHPIVGDPLYGWKSSPGESLAPRLLLHAHRITLAHPTSGASVSFEAPVPGDFQAALAALRALAPGPSRRRPK